MFSCQNKFSVKFTDTIVFKQRFFGNLLDGHWKFYYKKSFRILNYDAKSEMWIRWNSYYILPIIIGFQILETEDNCINLKIKHGFPSILDYKIVFKPSGNNYSEIIQMISCSLPWVYGGALFEKTILKSEVNKFLELIEIGMAND